MGAFAEFAVQYSKLSLSPTPTGGRDGKRPLIKGYAHKALSARSIEELAWKFPDANVALITGPSGLDVIDIDDPDLLRPMLSRFGETPLITKTAGRGGYQAFYKRGAHVRAANLRATEGLPVEIRAGGNIVIAPPSRSPITGRQYCCVEGEFDARTLASLPQIAVRRIFNTASRAEHALITEGHRNNWLFLECLRAARHVDGFDGLMDVAMTRNDELEPPLDEQEARKVAESAWAYQVEGRNLVGSGGAVILSRHRIENLCAVDPGNPIGLALRLELEHAPRVARGETFAVSRRAMAHAATLPGWSEKAIRQAKEKAEAMGLIVPVSRPLGGPVQYTLPPYGGGPDLGPNVTDTLSPLPPLPASKTEGH